MESILTSIKKLLGIDASDTSFDIDIIIDINSVLSILTQMGVGPEDGFSITGETETWSDFLGDNSTANMTEMVKSYVRLKVKLLFDTVGVTGAALASVERLATELEWRISVAVDPGQEEY